MGLDTHIAVALSYTYVKRKYFVVTDQSYRLQMPSDYHRSNNACARILYSRCSYY